MKFLDNVGDPSYFLAPLPDCLCHISFKRCLPLISKSSRNRTNEKVFGPTFLGGTTSTVLRQVVNAIYHPPFGKLWLSSVCLSPSAKPGNEVGCRIYGGWVKTHLQFEAVYGPKFI